MSELDTFVINGEERIIDTIILDGVEYTLAGSGTKHAVIFDLSNVSSSNTASKIADGSAYQTTLTAGTGLTIDEVIVTMGGVDITESAWNGSTGSIHIASVTASVFITASAVVTPDTITIEDVDSSLRTKTASVVEDVNNTGADHVAFVVLTDTHGSSNGQKSQNAIRYILKNSRANKCFWLGDLSAVNWSTSEYETFAAPLLNCADKVYPTLGNHEYFGNSGGTGLSEIYTDFLADKTLNGLPSSFYYYFDDTARKIRYIVINTSEGATNATSATQLTWLENAVQLPSSSWGLIAFSHFPLISSSESTEYVSAKRYQIRDILLGTNGTVIAYICGHRHADVQDVVDYSFYHQVLEADVKSGQAISVVDIDLTTHDVNIYRIGTGSDITFDYTDLPAKITRTITNTLIGCENSNLQTSIINGRPYSGTITSLPNYDLSSGTVSIVMGNTDITSTAYDSSTGIITISEVTGDIAITITAEYVEPITEYTAAWLVRDTSTAKPKYTFTSVEDAVAGCPDYLAFVMCNQETSWPTGYRNSSTANYTTRTAGWTTHLHYWKGGTDSNTAPNAITSHPFNNKNYCYITFTKAESDAAYALYQAAIDGGQIGNGGGISLIPSKTLDSNFEFWCIAQNVTESNIESIIKRLPAHT